MTVPKRQKTGFETALESMNIGGNSAWTAIGRVVCDRWGIWPEQLLGIPTARPPLPPSNLPHVHLGRHMAWYLAQRMTDIPVPEIAAAFGGYKPETVRRWDTLAPFIAIRPSWEHTLPVLADQLEAKAARLAMRPLAQPQLS